MFSLLFAYFIKTYQPSYEIPCDGQRHKITIDNTELTMNKACNFNISPKMIAYEKEERYRSYTFDQSGSLMVFISTEDDERLSRCTGARMFTFYPFQKLDKVEIKKVADILYIKTINGQDIIVNSKTGKIMAIKGFSYHETPMEHIKKMIKSKGGVEVYPKKDHLLLDYQFRLGEMPIGRLNRKSKLLDHHGEVCQFKNRQVYRQDPNSSDEVIFKMDHTYSIDEVISFTCDE